MVENRGLVLIDVFVGLGGSVGRQWSRNVAVKLVTRVVWRAQSRYS